MKNEVPLWISNGIESVLSFFLSFYLSVFSFFSPQKEWKYHIWLAKVIDYFSWSEIIRATLQAFVQAIVWYLINWSWNIFAAAKIFCYLFLWQVLSVFARKRVVWVHQRNASFLYIISSRSKIIILCKKRRIYAVKF